MITGKHTQPYDPDKPIAITFYVPFHKPGYSIKEQGQLGRLELLNKSIKNNKPLLSVISELPAENLYWAVKDNGAFCNGDKISVSSRKSINDSLLITGFAYQHDSKWETNMKLFKNLTKISHGVRRIGSAAADLCYVASGKADGFWEIGLYPWDSAAGILLVEEAGGKITRMDGKPYDIFEEQILATNSLIHDEMLENFRSEILS